METNLQLASLQIGSYLKNDSSAFVHLAATLNLLVILGNTLCASLCIVISQALFPNRSHKINGQETDVVDLIKKYINCFYTTALS